MSDLRIFLGTFSFKHWVWRSCISLLSSALGVVVSRILTLKDTPQINLHDRIITLKIYVYMLNGFNCYPELQVWNVFILAAFHMENSMQNILGYSIAGIHLFSWGPWVSYTIGGKTSKLEKQLAVCVCRGVGVERERERAYVLPILLSLHPLTTTILLSVLMSLTILDTSYKWNNKVFVFCNLLFLLMLS